ncbi:MAG: DUF6338 family protein [Proteobacteria bacterium]|nr:DUF6338 family protein [Pseudomonadota bacterium]
MNIWEIDKLIIFIAFAIPGFISIKVYDLLSPGEWRKSSKQVIDAVTFSCINYALLSWAIYLVEINNWHTAHQYLYAMFYLLVLFFFPVVWAYCWHRLRSTQLFQKNIPHPTGKPWDYVFSRRKWYWIIVTLKDGTKFAGKYGSESFTSSAPEEEQIYLEETWVVNEHGGFERPREQTAGIIIISSEIAAVELFEYISEGGQT